MTDRIDRYLEGSLERESLTPAQRAQADAIESAVEEIRLLADARQAPDLVTPVMRAIEQSATPPPRGDRRLLARASRALWASREVSFPFRPAYALVALLAAGILLAPVSDRLLPAPAPQAPAAGDTRLFVQFRLQAPDASTVRLAGSFTNWEPQHELHQTAPGIWTVTLPLPLGVHDYSFVVDGVRWVLDPYAQSVDNGFGGRNSRIALLPPDDPRS